MRLSGRQEGAAGGAPQGRRGMKGADDAQQSARASARGRKVDFSRWAPLLVFGGIWSRCSAPRCTSDAAETRRGTRTPLTSDCCCSRVARLHVLARSAASLSPRRRLAARNPRVRANLPQFEMAAATDRSLGVEMGEDRRWARTPVVAAQRLGAAASSGLCRACLLALALPWSVLGSAWDPAVPNAPGSDGGAGMGVGAGAGHRRTGPIYYGRIPAAQLAGVLEAHRARECGLVSSEVEETIRGGSNFVPRMHWDISLRATLWEGTLGERKVAFMAKIRKVAPLVAQACSWALQVVLCAMGVFSRILAQTLWLCCGIELGAVQVSQPTVAGFIAGLRSAIASSSFPTRDKAASSRGPLIELWRGLKSSGCALANVELDFFAACRHSLQQVATLALGRWPDASADHAAACEATEEDASSSSASQSQRGATNSHIKHVFLSQSPPSSGTHAAAGLESDWPSVGSSATSLSEESEALGNYVIIIVHNKKVSVHLRNTYVYKCIQTHTHKHTHTHTHTHTHLELYTYTHIHTHTHIIYIYIGNKIKVPIHLRAPGCLTASLVGSWNRWGKVIYVYCIHVCVCVCASVCVCINTYAHAHKHIHTHTHTYVHTQTTHTHTYTHTHIRTCV